MVTATNEKKMNDSNNKQEPAAKKKKTKVPREYMKMPEIKIPNNCDVEQLLHNIIYNYTKDFTCVDYQSLNENKKWNNKFKGMLDRMWDIKSNLPGQTHENLKNYINARTTVQQFVDYMDVVFKSQTVSKKKGTLYTYHCFVVVFVFFRFVCQVVNACVLRDLGLLVCVVVAFSLRTHAL